MSSDYLLVIDPQYDFCNSNGSLYVKNAETDMKKMAKFIDEYPQLDKIFISLDSHHFYQIFHSSFWLDENGENLKPFTVITYADFKNGKYETAKKDHTSWAEKYLYDLENKSKYPLMIWPYHCIIGSLGATINEDILRAIRYYETINLKSVEMILKGDNELTEHYSIIKSEVRVSSDKSTDVNIELIEKLSGADKIFIGGEALSHCVANTVRDMLESKKINPKKIILLSDTSSPVTGCEKLAEEFLQFALSIGVTLATTDEVLKLR